MFLTAFCLGAMAQSLPSLYLDYNPETLGKASSSTVTQSMLDNRISADASFALWQPKTASDKLLGFKVSGRIGERFALGLLARMYNYEPYDITSAQGITPQVGGSFTPKEFTIGLGGEFRIVKPLSAGVNVKFAGSSLASDAKASAICADIFARYSAGKVKAGLSVENLGGSLGSGDNAVALKLPAIARLGAEYEIIDGLNASLQAEYLFAGAFMAGVGAEYWIKDIVAPRVGFHYGPEDNGIPTYASAGIGAKFFGVRLNVAYLFANQNLANTLCFGLGYSF